MFGREEIEEITPAIEAAKGEGIIVDGPVPPDTVFSKARGGWYDIVVAMYHDQGHIPLKVVALYTIRQNRNGMQWQVLISHLVFRSFVHLLTTVLLLTRQEKAWPTN